MTLDLPQMTADVFKYLCQKTEFRPKIGIVLGSGLSGLAESFGGDVFNYEDLPHFGKPGVIGHAGKLYISKEVAIMAGRFHYYEGYGLDKVLLPVALLCELGCEIIIFTNASGSINGSLPVGSLALIKDHINFMGVNPLVGPHIAYWGARFPDMSQVYSPRLMDLAEKFSPNLKRAVYLSVSGPSYETPSEIKAFRSLGADLVGMSTVPEAIFARFRAKEILGISLITNLASGLGPALSHEEVMREGARASKALSELLHFVVKSNGSN